MAFLYGDSTESSLELNYIEFLKAALDFSVQVLLADHRIEQHQKDGADRKRATEDELDELRQLGEAVVRTLDGAPGAAGSAAQRCASALRGTSQEVVRKAAAMAKAQLTEQLAAIAREVAREHQVAGRALEGFLQHHDLPDASRQLDLALDSAGAAYTATLRGRSDIGLDWVVALDIPSASLFAAPLKLERIAPHLEVRVPEAAGWMRKGTRMRTQRLGGHYLVELGHGAQQTTLKLRATPAEDEHGLNLLVSRGAQPIRIVRVQKGGEHSPPFEPLAEDVPRLVELTDQLCAELVGLSGHRRTLIEGRLDGKPLAEHEGPSLAVRRLIGKMAPVVQEIARHGLSPDELVLKRVLADDRREEIFVAKSDLTAKLEPVPAALRALFLPLGLGGLATAVAGEVDAGAQALVGSEHDPDTHEVVIGRPEVEIDAPTHIQFAHEAPVAAPVEPAREARATVPLASSRERRPSEPVAAREPRPSDPVASRERRPSEPVAAREPRPSEPPAAPAERTVRGAAPPPAAPREGRRSEPPATASERPARTSEAPLPRASEVLRRPGGHITSHPPNPIERPLVPAPNGPGLGSDDDDVTMVATSPARAVEPAGPAPGAAEAGTSAVRPKDPISQDSVDLALNQLERDDG